MKLAPGTRFAYCSPGVHLLAGIIRETTGENPVNFARRHLFEPLGIQEVVWPADQQEVNHGWGDLHMYPHDMARLGYLYLRRGTWDGRQLLRPAWVAASTSQRVSLSPGFGLISSYGYLWWISQGFYAAVGRGGQVIAVHPEKHMVVVLTGGGSETYIKRLFEPQGLLLGHLFPAAVSAQSLPANLAAHAHLTSLVEAATRPPVPAAMAPLPATARRIAGKTYRLDENWLGWHSFTLHFASGEGRLTIDDRVRSPQQPLTIGLDNVYRLSPGRFGIPAALRGTWKAEDVFVLEFNEVGNINDWRITFTFRDDRVIVTREEMTGLPGVTVQGRTWER